MSQVLPGSEGESMNANMRQWAVGVITAPRPVPTLERTKSSLRATGFSEFEVFEDTRRAGCWPTWLDALKSLASRHPDATAYLMVEDDCIFCRDLPSYLEHSGWPSVNTAICSPYCPAPYRRKVAGWHRENHSWSLVSAVCWSIHPVAARKLITDLANLRSRSGTDAYVGRWAAQNGFDIWFHTPSLVQHIGNGNSAAGHGQATSLREACDFIGEDKSPAMPTA
jgi:hypothetical protein